MQTQFVNHVTITIKGALIFKAILFGIDGRIPKTTQEIAEFLSLRKLEVTQFICNEENARILALAYNGWTPVSRFEPVVQRFIGELRAHPRASRENILDSIARFRKTCGLQKKKHKRAEVKINTTDSSSLPVDKKPIIVSKKRRYTHKEEKPLMPPRPEYIGFTVRKLIEELRQSATGILVISGSGKNCSVHEYKDWDWLSPSSVSTIRKKGVIVWELGICKKGCTARAERLKR